MTRERLPETRLGITHRVVINDSDQGPIKLFITVNRYPDGRPGEVFITADQAGSTLDGFCDAWATAISIMLQLGFPMSDLVLKFGFIDFAPRGMTDNPELPNAKSIPDYVVRWMEKTFGEGKA